MTREEIDEFVEITAPEHIDDILLADDLDRAFVGIMFEPARAVYSIELCIAELATSMSKAEAEEYSEKQKEVEQVVNPIMRKVYADGGAPGMDEDEDVDFDDEL